MQAYDLVMLIVLSMATIFGAIKGFAWQVASIASVIVSYLVAYNFRYQVADMIQATPPWNLFLAMLLLYIGTSFAIWVGFRIFSSMIDRVRLKEFDRHLGAGFGFVKGLVYCLLITMFAMSLLGQNLQRTICQSKSGFFIASALDRGVGILPKEVHDVVGPYLAELDSKLQQGQGGPADGQPQDPAAGFAVDSVPSLNVGLGQLQSVVENLLPNAPPAGNQPGYQGNVQPGNPVYGQPAGYAQPAPGTGVSPGYPPPNSFPANPPSAPNNGAGYANNPANPNGYPANSQPVNPPANYQNPPSYPAGYPATGGYPQQPIQQAQQPGYSIPR
ncbi:MAG: CvpA family protein [Planctomycetota bacterium]